MLPKYEHKLQADFNGIFGWLLCLSHEDTAKDESGNNIVLKEGMPVMAFDLDGDEQGNPDNIVAFGIVEPSPQSLRCNGSKWVLRIFAEPGIVHESELP